MTGVTGDWIYQHSAGGVAVRRVDGNLEFLAVCPRGEQRWQLPKGLVERGESVEAAALREVREEGGIYCRILASLSPVHYFYRSGVRKFSKTVDFFLLALEGGHPDDHDTEVEAAEWFGLDRTEVLTFKSEREVVISAKRLLTGDLLGLV